MKYFTPFRPGQHDYEYAKRALEAGLTGFEAVYRESYETPSSPTVCGRPSESEEESGRWLFLSMLQSIFT